MKTKKPTIEERVKAEIYRMILYTIAYATIGIMILSFCCFLGYLFKEFFIQNGLEDIALFLLSSYAIFTLIIFWWLNE